MAQAAPGHSLSFGLRVIGSLSSVLLPGRTSAVCCSPYRRCCSLSCSALLRLLPFVLLCFTGPKLFPLVRHMQMTQGQFNLFNKYLCCSRRAFILHPLPPCSPLPVFVYSFGSLIKNCFDLLCFLCFCKHCAKFPD